LPQRAPRSALSILWVNENLGHKAVVQVFEKAIVEMEGSL
jgi:hypothetical protein